MCVWFASRSAGFSTAADPLGRPHGPPSHDPDVSEAAAQASRARPAMAMTLESVPPSISTAPASCDQGQHPEPDELLARAQLFHRQAAGSADEHDAGYPCRYCDLAKEVGQGGLVQVGADVADTRAPPAMPAVVPRRCHEMSWETGGSARSASMMAWSWTASLAAYVPP